ncbi:unnamed protein product [Penicillium glandicola]
MEDLARSDLFKPAPRSFTLEESTRLSCQRAKAFANAYGLTLKDVLYVIPKFWKLHREPLISLNGGAFTLLSIQCNLFVGTLAPFALKRPELQPILQSALDFDTRELIYEQIFTYGPCQESVQFMLTEVNHGLDARNIQTTATILPDGSIDLHTPSPNDAKVMPPTTPRGGIPVVAIVMARLVNEDKDCGIRPFAAFNAARFSQNRLISGQDGSPMAVIEFRTQHMPILYAIAQYSVLEAFLVSAATAFREQSVDPRVRHGIATALKAAALGHFSKSVSAMNERCGWHGHYEHNQLLQVELEIRGASTAEGDIRVLAIRLASELLIDRYQMPPPKDHSSLISQHEASLFSEARDLLQQGAKGAHRSERFNRDILPLALPLVEAVGHRMAYEASLDANIDLDLLKLYEIGVVKEDSAWYVEQGGLSRGVQREMEARAVDALLPQMKDLLLASGVQAYSNAPMTSKT